MSLKLRNIILALFLLLSSFISGHASQTNDITDPYEKLNRRLFAFNLFLDKALLRPTMAIYDTLIPRWGQNRISNFTSNLVQPLNLVNYIAQQDATLAYRTLSRFVINSTVGLGGLFNIASKISHKYITADQDFGLTAAYYGVPPGPYLMLPLLGPSTFRDAGGSILDITLNPITYCFNNKFLYSEKATYLVNIRTMNSSFLSHIEATSMDPYATIRSLYIQRRTGKPKGTTQMPNYDEYYFEEPTQVN